jgi:signal peptidase II
VTTRGAWTRAGLVVVGVLILDQVSKAIIRSTIDPSEKVQIFSFLHLVNTRNDGIAFGGLGGSWLVIVLVLVALVGIIVVFSRNATRRWAWLPAGLLLGGALGNIIDRVFEGSVTDFIKFPHWPQFNVADIAVTLGVISLIFVLDEKNDQ